MGSSKMATSKVCTRSTGQCNSVLNSPTQCLRRLFCSFGVWTRLTRLQFQLFSLFSLSVRARPQSPWILGKNTSLVAFSVFLYSWDCSCWFSSEGFSETCSGYYFLFKSVERLSFSRYSCSYLSISSFRFLSLSYIYSLRILCFSSIYLRISSLFYSSSFLFYLILSEIIVLC